MMPSVKMKSEIENNCGNETQTVINRIISRMDASMNDDISHILKTPTEIKSENVHFCPEKENSSDNSLSSCMRCQALQKKLKVSRGWNRFFKEKLLNYDKLLHIIEKYENEKKKNIELQLHYDLRSREWEHQQEQLITLYHEMQPLREKLKIAEETSLEEKKLRLKHQYREDSFKVTIEQLQAKVSHMNTIANPIFVENLEKKLSTARSENKKVKCNLEFKKAEVEELRSYITNKHIQVETLSKKLLWALQLAIKYGTENSRNRENTSEWDILQIQTQNIFRALKAQFDSFCATKRRELKGRRVELACLPKFSTWVVDFESSDFSRNDSPAKEPYSEDSKPIVSGEVDEEAHQLEKLLSGVNVEEVFANMNQLNNSLDLNVPKTLSKSDILNGKKGQLNVKKELEDWKNSKLEINKKSANKSSEICQRRRSRRSESDKSSIMSTDFSNDNLNIKSERSDTSKENSQPTRRKRVSSNRFETMISSVEDDKIVSSISVDKQNSKSSRLRRLNKSDKENDSLDQPVNDNLSVFKSRMNKSLDYNKRMSSTPIKKKSTNEVPVTPGSLKKRRKVVSQDLALSDSSSSASDIDDDTPLSKITRFSVDTNKRVKRKDRNSSSQSLSFHDDPLIIKKNIEKDNISCLEEIQRILDTFVVSPLGDHMPYPEDTDSSSKVGSKLDLITFSTDSSSGVGEKFPKKNIIKKERPQIKKVLSVPQINEAFSFVPRRVTRSSYKRKSLMEDSLESEQLEKSNSHVSLVKKRKKSLMSSDAESNSRESPFISPSPVRRRRRTNSKNQLLSGETYEELKNLPQETEDFNKSLSQVTVDLNNSSPLGISRRRSILQSDLSVSSSNTDIEERELKIKKTEMENLAFNLDITKKSHHVSSNQNESLKTFGENDMNLVINNKEEKEDSIQDDHENDVALLGLNLSEDSIEEEVLNSLNDSVLSLDKTCNEKDLLQPISSSVKNHMSNKDSLTYKDNSDCSLTDMLSEALSNNESQSTEVSVDVSLTGHKACDASQMETEDLREVPYKGIKESSLNREGAGVAVHMKTKDLSSKATKLTIQEISGNSSQKETKELLMDTQQQSMKQKLSCTTKTRVNKIENQEIAHVVDSSVNNMSITVGSSEYKTEKPEELFKENSNLEIFNSETGLKPTTMKFQSKLDKLFTDDESSKVSISPLTTISKRHSSTSSDFSVVLSESSYNESYSTQDDNAVNKSLRTNEKVARELELTSDEENSLIMDIDEIILPQTDTKDSLDNRQLSDSDNETKASRKNKFLMAVERDVKRTPKYKLNSKVDNIDSGNLNPRKIDQENANNIPMERTQDDNLSLNNSTVLPSFYKEREERSDQSGFQIPNIIFEESAIEEKSRNSNVTSQKNKQKRKERNHLEQMKMKQDHSEESSILLPQLRSFPAFQHTPFKLKDEEMNSAELQEYFEDILGCHFRSPDWSSLNYKICDKLDSMSTPNLLSKFQPLIRILLISVIRSSPFEIRDQNFTVPPTIYKLFQIVRIIEQRFNFPPFTLDSLVNVAAHKLILQNKLRPNSLASLTTWVICSCQAQYNKLERPKDEQCLRWGRGFLLDVLFHHSGLIHESLLAAVNCTKKIFIRIFKDRESTVVEKLIFWIAHHGSWNGPKATKTKLIEAFKLKLGLHQPPPEEPLATLRLILTTLIDINADSDEAASTKIGLLLLFRWAPKAWIIKSLFPLLKEVFYDDIIANKESLEELKTLLASMLRRSNWEDEDEKQFLESLKSFPIIKS